MFGNKVRKALIKLIRDTVPHSITGTVKSVDFSDYTCVVSPSNGQADYESVRIKPIVDAENVGVILKPAVGSSVVISPLQHNEHAYYVSKFSKVTEVFVKTEAGGTGILLNGNQFGGVVKAEVNKQKLNVVETQINQLKTFITTWAPAPGDGGAALKALLTAWASTSINLTTTTELENTNVKHG